MSIPILEACRKKKRRPKIFGLQTFCDPGCPISLIGPFRDNVRVFLQECAEREDYTVRGMPIWCTLLVHDNRSLVVPLYTIEEDVKTSEEPFCDQCRCTGWSNHFVSKRKYHMIIPVEDEWHKPLDNGILNLPTHLLHGLIHCNGFAHLVCINGLEGGSKHLYGREIMDLWDRICTNLRTRKISVEDASKKRSMDLRLLHGVAYGHSWFGRWGYRFCHGSFGVTAHNYERAIEILSSLALERILQDFIDMDGCEELKQIIRYYRNLSETKLVTIKDLLRFMLTVKSSVPGQKKSLMGPAEVSSFVVKSATKATLQVKPSMKEKSAKCRKFSTILAHMDSRWPTRRLEFAADVIVNALQEKKESGHGGMTRQDVRDAARLHIGDTGLLDYVLKSMNNVIVGNHIVCRAVNPATRILEYTVHDLADGVKVSEPGKEIVAQSFQSATLFPGVDVYNDVLYLYEHVLLGYPESELVDLATRAVLDAKHFVKECPFRDDEEQWLTFFCQLLPSSTDKEIEFKRGMPPGEVVVMPLHATIGELKRAAESALRDTYCITEQFVVMGIEGLEEMDDMEVLFGVAESGAEVGVRGSGIDLDTPLRYEGGSDTWMVRCECGARDDDGERMVACDICEVWQHTRCCGIEDADTVPPLFVCSACCVSLVPPRIEPCLRFDCSDAFSICCRH
ncbi:PHD finger protein MALE MEIOCYTE DEATH 1 [Pyrus x bretschneideri]|uniref:PHD finger protein MALE MEIOCYTE DEATH 1 n=1 Tax=Pyrus x bretschneideri TaxID=225117 RepID=UPI00202E6A2B|nr:PHD finger protein MALE MEIOCYTE DEATH 1 [Pyrus x bretschneideri]